MEMRIKMEIELDWPDVRTLDMIANQLGLDPEATIRFLIRKGIESLIRPPAPAQPEQNQPRDSDLVGTEIEVPDKNRKGGGKS